MSARVGQRVAWRRSPDALWRWTSDGMVALDASGAPLHLAGCGALVWELLELECGVDALVEEISRSTQLDRGALADSVRWILDELHAAGLVLCDEPSSDHG